MITMRYRSSWWRRTALTLLALAAPLAAPRSAPAAEVADAAREFEAEAERLEAEIDATQGAWQEQDALVRALQDEARALEASYTDPDASADELRKLEDAYEAALEAACRQARTTIASRRKVYDRMDRVAELGRKVEAERRAIFDAPMPAGMWRMEVAGTDLVGVLRLELDGASVRGTYRMSNGRAGSVSGTYGAGHLELTRFDGGSGRDAVLNAVVDEQSGSLKGEWVRFELGAGEPGSGNWSAWRVTDEAELPDLEN
jgi:hypothetical protein